METLIGLIAVGAVVFLIVKIAQNRKGTASGSSSGGGRNPGDKMEK